MKGHFGYAGASVRARPCSFAKRHIGANSAHKQIAVHLDAAKSQRHNEVPDAFLRETRFSGPSSKIWSRKRNKKRQSLKHVLFIFISGSYNT